MDYKELYECEMKRADKAEDALAAAQARIAELEAQLDNQEWHWGDELPPPYDWYLIFDWDAEDIDFVAMQVVWFDGEWNCDLTHWRKLPEAPRAAWAEAHRRKAE